MLVVKPFRLTAYPPVPAAGGGMGKGRAQLETTGITIGPINGIFTITFTEIVSCIIHSVPG